MTPGDERRARVQQAAKLACLMASFVVLLAGAIESAVTYPLTLPLDARATTPTTTIASSVTIRVDRLMEENRRIRVSDALKYNGYSGFLTALRALPAVGTIEVSARTVDVKYAHEQPDGSGRRLVLVADRPLFFLGGAAPKRREGYELTVVDLRFDAQGAVTGTMAGAARVKPDPDGGVVLDDFAEAPVQLTPRTLRP
jgi:hypothetical protein